MQVKPYESGSGNSSLVNSLKKSNTLKNNLAGDKDDGASTDQLKAALDNIKDTLLNSRETPKKLGGKRMSIMPTLGFNSRVSMGLNPPKRPVSPHGVKYGKLNSAQNNEVSKGLKPTASQKTIGFGQPKQSLSKIASGTNIGSNLTTRESLLPRTKTMRK